MGFAPGALRDRRWCAGGRAREKQRIVRRHLVPVFLIEIIDTVRERERKPARRMTLPVMLSNLPRLAD